MTKFEKDILGITIIAVCMTPLVIVLIVGAALSLAGCAAPDVICTFDWGLVPAHGG